MRGCRPKLHRALQTDLRPFAALGDFLEKLTATGWDTDDVRAVAMTDLPTIEQPSDAVALGSLEDNRACWDMELLLAEWPRLAV